VRSKTYTLLVGNIFAIEVGYTSTPEKFDQWLPKAESIIKSLRLLRVSKNEWKAYINEYYGFSVDYPADWKATVIPDATTNLMKNYMGESQIVFFTSPSEYPAGAVGETLSVSRKDLRNSPMSLDEYVKINDARSSKALPDYLRLYDKKADIAGHEACLESYTYGGVKCRRYVLIVDDIVYALTFKASSEKYSKFLPKAEKIMKSFKLSLSAPVENFAMEPPQQGTIIPCEECVVLYPEKYKADPKSCPLCHGQREHFQTARMMNDELAAVEGHELELKVEDFLLRAVLDARKKPVPIETLREIRDFYREKLIFHLIYDKFELEPIKAHILELDELISKSK
jgi:rubrerythrin